MRLDLDSLGEPEWETLEAVEAEPVDPTGRVWPQGTALLVKLVVWAGWGLFTAEQGYAPPAD